LAVLLFSNPGRWWYPQRSGLWRVPLNLRLGRDGFTRPLSIGEPLLDLFG